MSPAYDLNPVPVDIKPRILAAAINEDDGTASLDMAMSVAEYFELEQGQAKATAARVGKAVSTWRDEGARHGIGKTEMDRVTSAFEHNDLKTNSRKMIAVYIVNLSDDCSRSVRRHRPDQQRSSSAKRWSSLFTSLRGCRRFTICQHRNRNGSSILAKNEQS